MQDFDTLYREHAPHVRRFALHLSGDAAHADDITAETFVRVWATRESVRYETVRGLLFAIARNLFISGVRAAWRQAPLEDVHADPSPDPLTRAADRDAAHRTVGALRALDAGDREVLVLRAHEGLSYAEIGRLLGIAPGAAKVRVHRARRRLLLSLDRASALSPIGDPS